MDTCNKLAIVTGSTGYIGRKLIQYLDTQGWEALAIVRTGFNILEHRHLQNYKCIEYDGTLESLEKIDIKFSKVVVFHLASHSSIHDEFSQASLYVESNILFGLHILSFMHNKKIQNIIYAETYWQFDKKGNEKPNTLYSATKMSFSNILKYSQLKGINSISLVLYDVYGFDDHRPKLINLFLQKKSSIKEIKVSPGMQILDYVFIDDVTKAFYMAAENIIRKEHCSFNRYAIRSLEERTLREYIDVIIDSSGSNTKIVWGGIDYPSHQIMTPWLPGMEFFLENWRPKIKFNDLISNHFK